VAEHKARTGEGANEAMTQDTVTPAQRQILVGLAAGYRVETIAANLGITSSQYEWQRRQMLNALEAKDIAHALAIAVVRGIIAAEELRRAGVY